MSFMDPVTFLMEAKLPKNMVLYRTSPWEQAWWPWSYRCKTCILFQPPKRCMFVDGPVEETHWCVWWLGIPERVTKKK